MMSKAVPNGPRHINLASNNRQVLHAIYVLAIQALLKLQANSLG